MNQPLSIFSRVRKEVTKQCADSRQDYDLQTFELHRLQQISSMGSPMIWRGPTRTLSTKSSQRLSLIQLSSRLHQSSRRTRVYRCRVSLYVLRRMATPLGRLTRLASWGARKCLKCRGSCPRGSCTGVSARVSEPEISGSLPTATTAHPQAAAHRMMVTVSKVRPRRVTDILNRNWTGLGRLG